MNRRIKDVFEASSGVLFDVGWTLFDEDTRLHQTCEWISDQLKGFGIHVPTRMLIYEYEMLCRNTYNKDSLTRALLETCGLPTYAVKSLYEGNPWHTFDCTPYVKVKKLLKHLEDRGYKLGVVSNQGKHTRELLNRFKLTKYFSTIIISDEVAVRKPSLRIYELGLSELGLSANDCIYVGDRIDNDIVPAKKLGMKTVRVLTGPFRHKSYHNSGCGNISETKPDICIDSISSLYDTIKKLCVSPKRRGHK